MTESKHYSIQQLEEAVSKSLCTSDVCRLLNITICTYNYRRIEKLCIENSISRDHFDTAAALQRNKPSVTKEEIFQQNSTASRSGLRRRAIKFGLYTGKCEECGIGDVWNGKPLTIELDHVNGINDDNRVENLRWLCPNCHSQTPTHKNSANRHTRPRKE